MRLGCYESVTIELVRVGWCVVRCCLGWLRPACGGSTKWLDIEVP
jgi:hypothetical protein